MTSLAVNIGVYLLYIHHLFLGSKNMIKYIHQESKLMSKHIRLAVNC